MQNIINYIAIIANYLGDELTYAVSHCNFYVIQLTFETSTNTVSSYASDYFFHSYSLLL